MPHSQAPALALALATVIFAGMGCAHLPVPIEKPTASVEGVTISSVSFTGIDGALDISIFNPNSFGVPLESVDWQLALGSSNAVSGSFDLSQTIPAKASAPVVASLSIATRDAAAVAAALSSGNRSYTVRGTLRFTTAAGSIDVAFEHHGQLDSLAMR